MTTRRTVFVALAVDCEDGVDEKFLRENMPHFVESRLTGGKPGDEYNVADVTVYMSVDDLTFDKDVNFMLDEADDSPKP